MFPDLGYDNPNMKINNWVNGLKRWSSSSRSNLASKHSLAGPAWVAIRDHNSNPHAQLDPAGSINIEVIRKKLKI